MEKLNFERRAPVYWQYSIDSTNLALKEMADKGAESGTVLIAEKQSAGRGRQGRSFISPEGGIYLSMLLKPSRPVEECSRLTALAALAVHKALKKTAGVHTDIKWPNDLLMEGKKLCGILTELSINPQPQIILGIGLNLNTPVEAFLPDLADIACSVYSSSGVLSDRDAVTAAIIEELDFYFERWEKEGCFFLEEYRQLNICKDRDVLLISGEESRKARVINIEPDLSLKVRFEDGSEENVFFGEISLRI